MTERVQITRFRCSTCKQLYDTEKQAETCEQKPISHDRGVKVGDVVRITDGEGIGETATVEAVLIIIREWGHYAWERYWHTVALDTKCDQKPGNRLLTFDSYVALPHS